MDHIHTHSFFAMGCHMAVWLQSDQIDLIEVENRFHQAEAILTRFRPESELSQLNNSPEQWVQVSDTLWPILKRAVALADLTGGVFDPTLLSELEQMGYGQSFEKIEKPRLFFRQKTAPETPQFRYRLIRFDDADQAVWLPKGVKVDLGGIAKGYTAQETVNWLSAYGPCLLDAGGDLVAGSAPAGQAGWPVGISAPYNDGQARPNLLRMWLSYGCLATSGVDYRKWETDKGRKHHIIDPRTGNSAETDLLTVSIMMADASEAEAWATTSLILGQEVAYTLMNEYGIEALLINDDHHAQLTPNMRPHVQWEPDCAVTPYAV